MTAFQCKEGQLVGIGIGKRVGLPGVVEEGERQRLRSLQAVVSGREGEVEVSLRVPPADFAEELFHSTGVVIGPAPIIEEVARQEIVEAPFGAAQLELRRLAAEGAARRFHRTARILAAALGIDRKSAAQGVEAESWIGSRNQLDARYRRRRDQVPVDDVTERLIDPYAVLKHGHALWCAEQRGRFEGAEIDVRLKRIALARVNRDAGRILLQVVSEIGLPLFQEVLAGVDLHIRRDILEPRAEARQRRGADYLDGWQLHHLSGIVGGE